MFLFLFESFVQDLKCDYGVPIYSHYFSSCWFSVISKANGTFSVAECSLISLGYVHLICEASFLVSMGSYFSLAPACLFCIV